MNQMLSNLNGNVRFSLLCLFQREIDRLQKEGHQTLLREQEAMRQSEYFTSSSQSQQPSSTRVNSVPPAQSFEDFEAMVLKNLARAAESQKKSAAGDNRAETV